MASGIFSTVRVAGEGVALAVVGAVLSTLVAARISAAGLSTHSSAAQRLAGGDLRGALALLPNADAMLLKALYGQAFERLLVLLAGITAATAVVVFVFLGRGDESPQAAVAVEG